MRDASERVVLIRRHHKLAGTDQHWGRDRYNRLCRLLGCVPEELSEIVCIPHHRIETWLEKGAGIPPWVALHFVLLERAYLEAKYQQNLGPPVVPIGILTQRREEAKTQWQPKHD